MKKRKWLGVCFFFLLLFSGAATANAYERATFKILLQEQMQTMHS